MRAPVEPPQATIAVAAAPSVAPVQAQWWRLYHEPALDALVAEALAQNRDLRAAWAHLSAARAVLHGVEGERLPQTTVSAGAGRGSTLQDQIEAASHDGSSVRTGPRFDLGADMIWEADIFGQLQASVRATKADGEAEAALLDGARVAVAAQVVQAWADACGLANRVALAREGEEIARRNRTIVALLRAAGSASAADLALAEADEARAQGSMPQLAARRRNALAALAVLTGHVPTEIPPAAAACNRLPMADFPSANLDAPALLRRRPDVRAAERRLAAATARIRVAVGDLYPHITLGAAIASSAKSADGLDERANMVWRIGPLLSWSLPNISVARARIAQARAAEQEQLARFDAAILAALREVNEAASELSAARQSLDAPRRAAERSASVADLARRSRTAGAVDAVTALSAERSALADRATLAEAEMSFAGAQIALFRAFGGGWEDAPDPPLPAPIRPLHDRSED